MKIPFTLFLITVLNISVAFAQQKVKDGSINGGNLADKNAILELESFNKGLLHARVSLVESINPSPLSAHVRGMMVYNIATNRDVVPGIYYNDGTKWVLAKGNTGAQGPIGLTGPAGLKGDAGPQGVSGRDGNIGPKGDTGMQGPIGLTGPAGLKGDTGPQGVSGKDGNIGPKGDMGAQGPIGLTGSVGLKGDTGPQGVSGRDGNIGPKGDTGTQGPIGLTGPAGLKGDTGLQGVSGRDGNIGPKGDTGTQGPIGLTGPAGLKGDTGPQGVSGKDGNIGPKGDTGPQGGIGLIEAGTNTTVVGTGVIGDPYKINTPLTTLVQDKSTGIITYTDEALKSHTAALKGSASGNLLKVDENGGLSITPKDVFSSTNANNGLTVTNGILQLGGNLIQPTILTTDATNTLALSGLQEGKAEDKIVVADANGVLKTITSSGSANNWALSGNTLTGSEFLGSNNNFDLVFKRNEKRAGLISAMGSTSFGERALSNEQLNADNININSSGSTAFGYQALAGNTTGSSNTGVGLFALADNTTGDRNTAIGHRTFWGGTGSGNTVMGADAMIGRYTHSNFSTGNYNTAIGTESSGVLKAGNYNTSLGYYSLHWITDGSNNVGVGSSAGATNWAGSNNTFIGAGADATTVKRDVNKSAAIGYNAKVEADNSMVLGGTGVDAVKVGIGVTVPNSTLQVQGSVSANIRTMSSGTIADDDYTVLLTGPVSLPAAATTNKGRMYHLVNDTNSAFALLTQIRLNGTLQTITLNTYVGCGDACFKTITVQSDGKDWVII